ncbi:hypothetical protein LPC08_08630 [Roseomonas sp. OT10]|uniref:hypothetical protein n=1 Tax=Roseomonas cutis TaxID=2897332 RepID=UPI001E458613|nr:hypothetical protein [Roseomonas sp. OT10]UFN50662.1 hypothetical protein LPC08_08630 [Roseomonas sp. OT10]
MTATIPRLGLLAALAFAPAALAQTSQPSTQGTIGTPTNPSGGGSTMAQGTPGTTNPAATATPGTTAAPMAPAPMAPAPAGRADSAPPSSGGPNAPGTNNPPTTATPVAGANSFTEGQARSRIEAAGFTDVTGLRKDDNGVWRGQGMRGGSRTEVGLDFQGNVVVGNAPAR